MPPFSTRYACLFCHVIHASESTLGVHLDANVKEYASRRHAHSTDTENVFHSAPIIRSVRSLVRGGRSIPWGTDEPGCSDWTLIIPIHSQEEQRAHCLVDRKDLTTEWWEEFARAGLKPLGVAGDPRVGTGWVAIKKEVEEKEKSIVVEQQQQQQPKRKRAPKGPVQVIDLTSSPSPVPAPVAIKSESPLRKRSSKAKPRNKGKGKQSDVIDLLSDSEDEDQREKVDPPDAPGESSKNAEPKTPHRGLADHRHVVFSVGKRSHAIGVEGTHMHGPITIGEKNQVGCSTTSTDSPSAESTPRPVRSPITEFEVFLVDTNRTVTVHASDSLATIMAGFAESMPAVLKLWFTGIQGVGKAPAWAKIGDEIWQAKWNEGLWADVKKKGGRQAPIEIVKVEGCWDRGV